MITNSTDSDHSNFTFSALAFGLIGWALFHASLTCAGVAIGVQILAALVGLSVVYIAFRRCWLFWLKFGKAPSVPDRPLRQRLLKVSDAGWGTLLLVIGNILGQLVLLGWVTELGVFAISLTFVPWSRVPFCRRHFLASISLILVGAAYPLLSTAGSVSALQLAVCAWAFWMSFLFAFLRGR